MNEIKSTSIRAIIMDMLKQKFGGFIFWQQNEADIAMLCAELPEAVSENKKEELIKGLKNIKAFMLDKNVEQSELGFLDEEIERYKQTKQITLYEEQDDEVSKEIIEKYSRLSFGTEGIMGIHLPYNYEQLRRLTNGVYKQTGLIKFYISRETTIYGKIIAEIYEHSQEIPIATLVESKKIHKETGDPLIKKIAMFGERVNAKEFVKIKEIKAPFYIYRFITEHNQDLILLTPKPCEIGDYIVTGVVTHLDDYKALTESARLPTKLPYIFAQSMKNRIIKFKDRTEFKSRISYLNVSKTTIFNYPFTVRTGKKKILLRQPEWFKWLIWAWLTHAAVGLFNNYPLHIMMIGPKHSGKSLMLNSLHDKSQEARKVFSGSSSTLKHLTPSFKYNPARLGYLAESNRFAFCDEFLRCLVNTRTSRDGSQREEGVAIMNDLLEHQKREAGSGVSRVNVNMTSRILATTNPIKEIHNIEDLINHFDESFLSRFLVYYQPDDHVGLIRNSKDSQLKTVDYDLADNDWIGILDYLHTFHADYDMGKVEDIKLSEESLLSETLKKHYDARHMHHIECLMDGIIKTRCLMEKDMAFSAQEKDYDMLKLVWRNIIKSWINPKNIRNLPVDKKIFYLPENSQYIYWKIVKMKRPVSRVETEELALKEMDKKQYIQAMIILLDQRVLIESDGILRPHYMGSEGKIENEKQQRLLYRTANEELV